MKTLRIRLAGMIGNLLGHYDTALYGLAAPFIAPLFFDHQDPLTALILAYSITPLAIFTRPLGALFFGWIGDTRGRKHALFFSLLGMAVVTALMGSLPTYSQIGALAPCLLALGRMLQGFFAAGESTGASIFVLENTPVGRWNLASGWYDVSSVAGMLIASGLTALFCIQGWMHEGWRVLFWLGSATALFGIFLRFNTHAVEPVRCDQRKNVAQALRAYRGPFLAIVLASGFSYTTYAIPFTLMNSYAPFVAAVQREDVMAIHTALLVLDICLLPCFGWLAQRMGKEKVMFTGALCSAATAIPLFACLEGASIVTVTLVCLAIVIFGAAFAAPYHAWKMEQVPPEYRYTLLSLGGALSAKLIGAPVSVVCLWLYQKLGVVWAPGMYLAVMGSLAAGAVYACARSKRLAKKPLG